MNRWRLTILCGALLIAGIGSAHEVRPAHLSVTEVSDGRYLVRWKVPAMGDQRLAVEPIFGDMCSEVEDRVEGNVGGASVRAWQLECTERLSGSRIEFSNLSSTMIDVWVQCTFLDGRSYSGIVRPSNPVFEVPVRQSRLKVFADYLGLGVEHILFGWDHLLFVLGLVLLVTDGRRLIGAITGFTIAHSITLALATLDWIRVPGPPVEAVIALSIVLLAVEVSRYRQTGVETLAVRAPWIVSMAIGLIHGLGFAGALNEFGLPPHARFVSLMAFNLGVEAGQLAFVAMLLLAGLAIRRMSLRLWSPVQLCATWLMGVCGTFWLIDRAVGFYL